MVVRIRFRQGPRVEKREGKNSRIAWLVASLLTLGSVSCLVLGLWRLGEDFGWTSAFVFAEGSILSHWQVWVVAACAIQFVVWRLNRYGTPVEEEGSPAAKQEKPETKAAASA